MTSISSAYVGQFGSDLGTTYDVQMSRYKQKSRILGYTDFKSNLFMSGVDGDGVLQDIENTIEGGGNGDGENGNLLSWDHYLKANGQSNNFIFGSPDSHLFTNINFNAGEFDVMNEESFSNLLGMDWSEGKPYDIFSMGQNMINFYEFQFGGVDDGKQANLPFDMESAWGKGTYIEREVDTSYWYKGIDYSDPESIKSYTSLQEMINAMDQWITDDDKAVLDVFEPGTTEYYQALYRIIIDHMDQQNIA